MSKTLEFFFDLGSPASYLAWTQIEAVCRDRQAQLLWRPMLLGGVFQATGNASPAAVPAKGAYVFTDLSRFARRYGVPLQRNPFFPVNTLTLMRAAVAMQLKQPGRFQAYLGAMFKALWVEQLNLGDATVLTEVLTRNGFDAQSLLGWAAEPEVKEALKSNTEEAVRRGVFGAPTFFVGPEMFFGQDRLDFVKEALA